MTVILKEFVDDRLYKTHEFEGEADKVFKDIYAKFRFSRYDWRRSYVFENQSDSDAYYAWVKKNETIEMYYGGGVVD